MNVGCFARRLRCARLATRNVARTKAETERNAPSGVPVLCAGAGMFLGTAARSSQFARRGFGREITTNKAVRLAACAHAPLGAIRPVSASSALVRATFLVARRAQRSRRAKQTTFLVARNLWSQWPAQAPRPPRPLSPEVALDLRVVAPPIGARPPSRGRIL
jgi:hypothetical protein